MGSPFVFYNHLNSTQHGKEELTGYNVTFTAPSGYEYTIREQNGADDDILSNPSEASTLINISRFIAGIVIDTNSTANRKLTVEQAHMMPSLDRYAILINPGFYLMGKT